MPAAGLHRSSWMGADGSSEMGLWQETKGKPWRKVRAAGSSVGVGGFAQGCALALACPAGCRVADPLALPPARSVWPEQLKRD